MGSAFTMAGGGGCLPTVREYSPLTMDQNDLFSGVDEAGGEVGDPKDAGALFVLESKGTDALQP